MTKWASRAVVILQLAAWSAVGIVLLHKGVSSLQKGPELKNITKIIPVQSSVNYNADEKNLSVIPIENSKSNEKDKLNLDGKKDEVEMEDDDDGSDEEPKVLESVDSLLIKKLLSKNKLKLIENSEKKWIKLEKVLINSGGNIDEQSIFINNNNTKNGERILGFSELNDNQRLFENKTDTDNDYYDKSVNNKTILMFKNNNGTNKTIVNSVSTSRSNGIWESKRRLRLSHLSGGGAAAAVAMVAVGAVMLILGPAVIVLRALDERRQERRFLKLSARDDLPPSYEQATLMDEAPRYSTLSLNTILDRPPPPPSPSTPSSSTAQSN